MQWSFYTPNVFVQTNLTLMSRTIIYQNKVILSLKLKLTQRSCEEKVIALIKHFIDICQKEHFVIIGMLFRYTIWVRCRIPRPYRTPWLLIMNNINQTFHQITIN